MVLDLTMSSSPRDKKVDRRGEGMIKEEESMMICWIVTNVSLPQLNAVLFLLKTINSIIL
jgi:hypothetical protein